MRYKKMDNNEAKTCICCGEVMKQEVTVGERNKHHRFTCPVRVCGHQLIRTAIDPDPKYKQAKSHE